MQSGSCLAFNMKFFHIKNLSGSTAYGEPEPWNVSTSAPTTGTKDDYRKWCTSPETEHYFYSLVEGANPSLRTHKDNNPAFRLHGIVADYDSVTPQSEWPTILQRAKADARPFAFSRTWSGNLRVLWKLAEPVQISGAVWEPMLKELSKSLGLKKLHAGFDEGVFANPNQYYECGTDWQLVDGASEIPAALVQLAIFEVLKKGKVRGDIDIPLDLIEAQITKQFPNKWRGPFELHSRGVRFWIPTADGLNNAVVLTGGMWDFVDNRLVAWAEIFGRSWVQEFEMNKIGKAVEHTYWDGKSYWVKGGERDWIMLDKADLSLRLRCQGFSQEKVRGDTASEIDRVINTVHETRRIGGALPLCHQPEMVREHDRTYLNIARVECVKPAQSETPAEWGKDFPWIAGFLEEFFDPSDQLEYYHAWAKRFYEGALEKNPAQGQSVFICGAVHAGKTLLVTRILAGLMGGHTDAADYLMGGNQFTAHLFAAPIWVLDDATPTTDSRRKAHYSALVKKITANTTSTYHAKFQTPCTVRWRGRLVVTMNDDPVSIQTLPDTDLSILDKIMLFRCRDRKFLFPPNTQLETIIATELPHYGKWLLEWQPPEHVIAQNRYGVVSYHEAQTHDTAKQNNESTMFGEMLESFFEEYFDRDKSVTEWAGNASDLKKMLNMGDSEPLARQYNNEQFVRRLRQLHSVGWDAYDLVYSPTRRKRWTVSKKNTEVK
jgi:hypothetical protein